MREARIGAAPRDCLTSNVVCKTGKPAILKEVQMMW
jgi:hypothetical protein